MGENKYRDALVNFCEAVDEAAKKYLPQPEKEPSDDDTTLVEPYGGFFFSAFCVYKDDEGALGTEVASGIHGRTRDISRAVFANLEDAPELLDGIIDAALAEMDNRYDEDPDEPEAE